jgi:hypothetical protein
MQIMGPKVLQERSLRATSFLSKDSTVASKYYLLKKIDEKFGINCLWYDVMLCDEEYVINQGTEAQQSGRIYVSDE